MLNAHPPPDESNPAAPRWLRAPRRRGAAFRAWTRGAAAVAAGLGLAWGWLATRGLPDSTLRRLESEISKHGWIVHIGRLRLTYRGEWKGSECTIRPAATMNTPILDAGRVAIRMDWVESLRLKQPQIRAVGMSRATIRWTGSESPGEAIRDIHVRVDRQPAGWFIRSLQGTWRGLTVNLSGLILHSDAAPRSAAVALSRVRWLQVRQVWDSPHWPEWSGPARLDADVLWNPGHPAELRLTLRASGGSLRWNGMTANPWMWHADVRPGWLELHRLEARVGDTERISVRGRADLARRTCSWEADGAVRLERWRALPLPPALLERAGRARLYSEYPVDWSAQVKDAPWPDPAQGLRCVVRGRRISALGVHAEEGEAELRRDGARWWVERAEIRPGRDDRAGLVRGSGFYDFASRSYGFDGYAEVYPESILPVLNPSQSRLAGALVCRGPPPRFTGSIRGAIEDIQALRIEGDVAIRDAVFRGSAFTAAEGRMAVARTVMTLSPMKVEGAGGAITGSITQDFSRAQVEFEVDSRMHPQDVARFAGPAAHRFAQRFRFEGPTRIRARGRVDYGAGMDNQVTADVEAQRMGLLWVRADEARMKVEMAGRSVFVREVQGRIGDGAFEGDVEFDLPSGDRPRTAYRIQGTVSNTWLHVWIPEGMGSPERASMGRVNAELELSGQIGEGQGGTAAGRGTIRVREGRLLQIPLLGPISRLVNVLIPGAGMAEQTEFIADVTIRDGRVHTRGAFLRGRTISLEISGSAGFGGDLKMKVHLRLLRGGIAASVLRMLTFPVTKLFEFNLTGTMDRPEWEPRNLPKELLLQFD